jgi:type IV pilus assembly protein PilO
MATGSKGGGDQSFAKLPVAGKLGLLGLLVALLCAVYYFAFHMSVSDDLVAANGRHTELLNEMQAAQQRNAEYVRLREQLAAREALDRGNLRALPELAETASFLQDLNRLAEVSGLRMRLVEPRPEEAESHYVRLPVNLQLTGRYHQLARFFYNVSRLDRLINMENIRLNNPRAEGDDFVVDVDVLATTYRRPRADEGQPASAAGTPSTSEGGS